MIQNMTHIKKIQIQNIKLKKKMTPKIMWNFFFWYKIYKNLQIFIKKNYVLKVEIIKMI